MLLSAGQVDDPVVLRLVRQTGKCACNAYEVSHVD